MAKNGEERATSKLKETRLRIFREGTGPDLVMSREHNGKETGRQENEERPAARNLGNRSGKTTRGKGQSEASGLPGWELPGDNARASELRTVAVDLGKPL